MDKATRRQIKTFEKGAEKAAQLKEAACPVVEKGWRYSDNPKARV